MEEVNSFFVPYRNYYIVEGVTLHNTFIYPSFLSHFLFFIHLPKIDSYFILDDISTASQFTLETSFSWKSSSAEMCQVGPIFLWKSQPILPVL